MKRRLILFVGLALLSALVVFAQSSGTIQGVVADTTGAVIPGAEVKAVNQNTGVEYSASSNGAGFFLIQSVPPGRYTVTCTSAGMAPSERPNVTVEVAQTLRMDFKLAVGTVAEVVEVSAAAQLIQSEKTDVGQVIEGRRIVEMPLNGRNYLELARFSVGVLPSREMGKGTRQDGEQGGEGGFLAMGMHAAQNNILLDGSDNSSRNSGGPLGFQSQAVKPPVDAVGEFKVVTNNTAAEYGFRTGAKVLVNTKSGTNEFHGGAYWFVRNDAFDATNFFANASGSEKPSLRRNQFGGTLGGPILRNKMFIFGSYQGTRLSLGKSFTSSVPSLEVKEDHFFGNQLDPNRAIFDPESFNSATGQREAFANFTIPASRLDPLSQALLELYPNPNIAGRENLPNNFFHSPVESNDWDQYDFRWDWNINDKHRWFIRYSIRNEDTYQPGPLPEPATGGTGQTIRLDGDNVATSFSSTLSATTYNELRFGYTHFPTKFDIPFTENLNALYGITGAPGDSLDDGNDHGLTLFTIGPFQQLGPRGFWPNNNDLDNWTITDHLTMVKGNHTLKFGGEFRNALTWRLASRHRRGNMTFNGVYTAEAPDNAASRGSTGSGAADFLLGWANNIQWGVPNGENHIARYWAAFIQDDWKITPKLTINLGVRWELFEPATFPDVETQTVSRLLTEINGPEYAYQPEMRTWGAEQWRPLMVAPSGDSDCGCEKNWLNFAPRVGLAYRFNEKTVFRAGAGLFYGEADNTGNQTARFATGAPLAIELTDPQGRVTTNHYLRDGFPVIPEGAWPANTDVTTTHTEGYRDMYAGQWFVDLQRELGWDTLLTIGYNGTSTSFIPGGINLDIPQTPHPTIRWQDRNFYNFFNGVTQRESMHNANYNSLTVKGEKRFSGGLTFITSFTWSHNIDFGNEDLQQENGSTLFTWDQSRDRGNSSLDRRKAWVTSVIYELPFGPGKPWANSGGALNYIVSGWSIGGIISFLDGTWDSHTINQDTTNVGGANRGDVVGDINLPSSERTIERWFNTAAIVPGQPGQLDTAGRNMIEGPGRKNYDVIVSRSFAMPWEGHALQFRFESFNFTNTPFWGRPNTGIGGAAAGTITDSDEPRRIQFGLKYNF